MALVAPDPVFVGGFNAALAPILLRVIRLELLRRELWLRPDQATRSAMPQPKAYVCGLRVYFFIEDGLRFQRTAKWTCNTLRARRRALLFEGIFVFVGGHFRNSRKL